MKYHIIASLAALALAALYDTRFRDPGPPPQPEKIECATLTGTTVRACQPIPPAYDRSFGQNNNPSQYSCCSGLVVSQ